MVCRVSRFLFVPLAIFEKKREGVAGWGGGVGGDNGSLKSLTLNLVFTPQPTSNYPPAKDEERDA